MGKRSKFAVSSASASVFGSPPEEKSSDVLSDVQLVLLVVEHPRVQQFGDETEFACPARKKLPAASSASAAAKRPEASCNGECCHRHTGDGHRDEGGQRGLERAGLEADVDGSFCVNDLMHVIGQGFGARRAEARRQRSVHDDAERLQGVRVATREETQMDTWRQMHRSCAELHAFVNMERSL